MRAKWETERDILELEGQRNELANQRDEYEDRLDNAKERMERYSTEARQLGGLDQQKAMDLRNAAKIDYDRAMADYRSVIVKINAIDTELGELDRELKGDRPEQGVKSERLTPEKARELRGDGARDGIDDQRDREGLDDDFHTR